MVPVLRLYEAGRGEEKVHLTLQSSPSWARQSTFDHGEQQQVQEKPTLQTAKAKYLVWEAAGRSPSFSLPQETKDSRGLSLNPEGLIHHPPNYSLLDVNVSVMPTSQVWQWGSGA